MKLTIECNEEQADIIVDCLEECCRLRMRQAIPVAQFLADDTFTYDKSNPYNDKLFDEYIQRRDNLEIMYQALMDIAYGKYCDKSSDRCRNISDMWSVIRHELFITYKGEKNEWDVRGREPIQLGTLPLISVEVER